MKERPRGELKNAPTLFIGKWTTKVMCLLRERPHRHGELRRRLGVSQRMLTRTLRNLETAGLISREVVRSKPVAVKYSLTKLGDAFIDPLRTMYHWIDRHGSELRATVPVSQPMLTGQFLGRSVPPTLDGDGATLLEAPSQPSGRDALSCSSSRSGKRHERVRLHRLRQCRRTKYDAAFL
jgi:DNA-binding HxlR family transcriptional regulator